jgi:HEAT repeat protein
MQGRLLLAVAVAVTLGGPVVAADARADDDELPASSASDRLPRLVEALSDSPSFKVRATAAVALGRLADARAFTALVDALRSDAHYAVRVAAASALARLPTSDGIPSLLAALNDDDPFVREEASSALDRFHTPAAVFAFREALLSDEPRARLAAVRAYGDVLKDTPHVAPLVINALGDDNEDIAHAAETALAGIAHARAVTLLVAALSSGESQVRGACARLLSKRADPSAVEPLIALMTATDESEEVRQAARDALRAHKGYLDVNARIAAAGDAAPGQRDARIASLRVVAAVNDPGALELIDNALRDSDPSVRVGAARAASDLGGARGKHLLARARAQETDPRTQRQLELLLKSTH